MSAGSLYEPEWLLETSLMPAAREYMKNGCPHALPDGQVLTWPDGTCAICDEPIYVGRGAGI